MQMLINILKPSVINFILILILFTIQPMLSVFIITLYLPLIYQYNKLFSQYLFVILIVFVVFVNATKIPEADLSIYYHWFEELKDISFFDALKVKNTDPIFTYITSMLGVFYYNKTFIIFWNAITVLFLYISIIKVNKYIGNRKEYFLCAQLFIMVFYFLQPEHITHTTRAFASVAFMVLAYSYFLEKGNKRAFIYALLSVGIHSSSILLLGLFFGRKFCFLFFIFSLIFGYSNISELIVSLSSLINLPYITEKANYYQPMAPRGFWTTRRTGWRGGRASASIQAIPTKAPKPPSAGGRIAARIPRRSS